MLKCNCFFFFILNYLTHKLKKKQIRHREQTTLRIFYVNNPQKKKTKENEKKAHLKLHQQCYQELQHF